MASLHRIYAETLSYEEVTRPTVLGLLRKYELTLVLAVRPWNLAELPETAKKLAGEGIDLVVWPMLSDEEGRWANATNAESFARFCESTLDVVTPRELMIDLEPPFAEAKTLAASPARGVIELAAGARGYRESERVLSALVKRLRLRGVASSCAVWPLIALDPPNERHWQEILGTPVDALEIDHVSVMVYTSIIEGWSRGTVRRDDALALLGGASERIEKRWGSRGSVSLGCVGIGAFEDEPVYRNPSELAEDVARVKRAGCNEIALFDLGGVLAREPAEAWLDALATPASEAPNNREADTHRVRAARPVLRGVTSLVLPLLGALARRL